MSSRDISPKSDTTDLNSGQEGGGVFSVTSCNSPPALEMKHCILDEMTESIEGFVILPLEDSILFGRNDWSHPLLEGLLDDGVGIVGPISKEVVCDYAPNERACLRTICCGTCCNKNSDRHTMRIHGQMYLGVEPPFV